jgi:hypothetical protein
VLSILQDEDAQPSYTFIGFTFLLVSTINFWSLKTADRGGLRVLQSWLSLLSQKLSPIAKRFQIEFADPLDIVKVGIQLTKAKDPKHIFTTQTRA